MNTTTTADDQIEEEVVVTGEEAHSSSSEMSEPSLVHQPSMMMAAVAQDEAEGVNKQATTVPAAMTTTTTTKKSAFVVRLLRWYVRFSSSAFNQDKLLKLLVYTLKVCCHPQQDAWSQKIANEITMARYVTRLVGWPFALEAAWNNSWAVQVVPSSSSSTTTITRAVLHKWLGRILAYSMVLYYPTEHLAYALWMKPPPAADSASSSGPITTARHRPSRRNSICHWRAETWSYVSNRCWLVYIVAEMVQSVLQLQDNVQTTTTSSSSDDNDDPQAAAAAAAAAAATTTNTQLSLARNALMVLPCLNWSRSDWDTAPFFVSTATINGLLWAESILTMYQAWRNSWE